MGPSASEETGEAYRPVTNWVYRGSMNPEFVRQNAQDGRDQEEQPQSEEIQRMASAAGGSQEASSQGQQNRGGTRTETEGDRLAGGGSCPPRWKSCWT